MAALLTAPDALSAPRFRALRLLEAHAGRRGRPALQWLATLATLAVFAGLSGLLEIALERPETVVTLAVVALGAVCVLRWPVAGVYAAAAASIMLDIFPPGAVHTFISDTGFFRNLNLLGLPQAVSISMFEILLAVALIRAIAGRFHRRLSLARGPLFWPVLVFGLVVVAGEVHGLLGHGDLKITLWEIRSLLYLPLLFILTTCTVSKPQHIRVLLWITVLGIGLRCLEGIGRYYQTPPNVRGLVESFLEHDDSLFLALAVGLLIAATLWRRRLPPGFYPLLLLIMPLAGVMMVMNKRRAVFLCAILVVVVLLPLIWISLRSAQARWRLVAGLLVLALLGGVYLRAFWNSTSSLAEPARAVRSIFDPDDRDASSNLYRDQENANLHFTINRSPIIGIGFGKPFDEVVPMVSLENAWALQFYMPHNNMLWLWLRLGLVGFAVFWALVGAAVLLVCAAVRLGVRRLARLEELERAVGAGTAGAPPAGPRLRTLRREARECAEFLILAYLVLAMLAALLALAAVDQGLMSTRLMAYAGLLLGGLAAGWQMYSTPFRAGAGEPAGEPTAQEATAHAQRRRVRIVSPI